MSAVRTIAAFKASVFLSSIIHSLSVVPREIPGDIKYYDIVSFLGENKDDRMFLTELRRDINTFGYQLTNEEIKQYLNEIYDIMLVDDLYYGLYYGSFYKDGVLRHGLRLKASLATYLTTNDFYKIPHSIWVANQKDLKSQIAHDDIYGAPYLGGTNSIGYKIEKGVITNRIFPLSTDADGLPIYKLSEKEVEEGWELGAAIRQPDGTIKAYPQALITLNDRRVRSGFSFSDDGSVKFDPRWFLTFQENVLSHQGKNYGIRILNVLATGQGAFNTFVYSESDLTNNHLKNGMDWEYANKYFADDSWTKSVPKQVSLSEWSFFDYDFIKDPNFDKILSEAEEFKEALFRIHRRQISDIKDSKTLSITEEDLKKLNTFTKGGISVEGKGYEQLSAIFTKLLGVVNYEDTNSRVYKITNIRFKTYTDPQGNTQEYTKIVRNIVFRGKDYGNSQKVWLKEILAMLKQYKDKIPASLDETDRLLYDLLITKDEHGNDISIFENDEFSPDALSGKLIQRDGFDDIKLAKRILGVFLGLIGRFTLNKIIEGSFFIKNGKVRFISLPENQLFIGHRLFNLHLLHKSQFPGLRSRESIRSSQLDFLYSTTVLDFVVESHHLVEGFYIPSLPNIYYIPFYQDLIQNKRLSDIISRSLGFEYSVWAELNNYQLRKIEGIGSTVEGGSLLWDALSYKYDLHIQSNLNHLLTSGYSLDKIFLWQECAREELFKKLFSENPNEFRSSIIEYLDTRGSRVLLSFRAGSKHEGAPAEIFNMILEESDWFLFADFCDIMVDSVVMDFPSSVADKQKIVSSVLRYQKEEIILIKNFLNLLISEYGRLRLYGYTMGGTGFGRRRSSVGSLPYYARPVGPLDPNMPGSGTTINDMWFDLDEDSLDQFDFHLFLGALLADHQMFILRFAPNPDGSSRMEKNEILFAFSFLINDLDPNNIIISTTLEVKPGFRKKGQPPHLFTQNPEYEKLKLYWHFIVEQFKKNNVFYGIHKFNDIQDWRSSCVNGGVPPDLE